jgi:hypothetical protein
MRIEDAKRWRVAKSKQLSSHKAYKSDTMPIIHIRQILDSKLPDCTDMDPNQALDMVYQDKLKTLVKNMSDNFGGISQKIDVSELLASVRSPKLEERLGG